MNRVCIFILSILASSSLIGADSADIRATLSIEPGFSLPGLSVPLKLTIHNDGPTVRLGPGIRVRVTSSSGETFFAGWGNNEDFGFLDVYASETVRTLPSGETTTLVHPAVDLDTPSWALDRRLRAAPGRWSLQVLLYDMDGEGDDPLVVSSPAALTVERASPRDEEIVYAIARGRHRGLAERVHDERPDSPYLPYLVPMIAKPSPRERAELYRQVLERHPETPLRPWLQLAIADAYESESLIAIGREGDLDKAVALAERARKEFLELGTMNAWAAEKARARLESLPDRARFRIMRGED